MKVVESLIMKKTDWYLVCTTFTEGKANIQQSLHQNLFSNELVHGASQGLILTTFILDMHKLY